MLHKRLSVFFVAAGLLCSAAVWAQEAYTTRDVNVRAGPGQDYPAIATLAPGTPVTVAGCLSDYLWCDVIYGDIRGWAYAKGLQYTYESRMVPIYGYGAAIGLPIITFSLLSYWDNYYRDRPFYRDRPRWENWSYRSGPGFVAPPRNRELQYRQPRAVEPQYRQPRVAEPQYRQPRVAEPQYRQPRVAEPQNRPARVEQQQAQPQAQPRPQQAVPQPRPQPQQGQPQPQQRPQGASQGNRPASGGGGEKP